MESNVLTMNRLKQWFKKIFRRFSPKYKKFEYTVISNIPNPDDVWLKKFNDKEIQCKIICLQFKESGRIIVQFNYGSAFKYQEELDLFLLNSKKIS